MNAFPVISVVFPLFNEEKSVYELIGRTVTACKATGACFEIVTVNDGSTDGTYERLVALSKMHPEMRIIDLFRNVGHMAALTAGIHCAKGKAVVIMDGDLQDPPELIPRLFMQWQSGAEVVYGERTHRGEGRFQRAFSNLFYWLLSAMSDAPIPRQAGTFCLLDRRIADMLNACPERQRFFAGLRAYVGGRSISVSYNRPGRKYGASRVGWRGLLRLARTALVSFSKVPLRYASLFSLLSAFILFFTGVTAIVIRLFTDLAIPGWATFTALIGFVGFVQSAVLAIMAEYIAVIFDETKARPLYGIRSEVCDGHLVASCMTREEHVGQCVAV
ncbi:hypothetical protein A3D11_03750 [Candidatus Peribacteria bacterium RIFCSPHIGHO2_02_FULL_49_16]|nr:MAG: hypothetical protein A2880_04710 [Candidatus Peribacteria bacterium RIFCSPHIGHO2_01_FULL_49_38]OGJ58848.1 MAG: hypothetical protein A3D11_03750 [Candidatus Peribacteria bacterium RIFCSPHIGHO2_02_FULL_49_16]